MDRKDLKKGIVYYHTDHPTILYQVEEIRANGPQVGLSGAFVRAKFVSGNGYTNQDLDYVLERHEIASALHVLAYSNPKFLRKRGLKWPKNGSILRTSRKASST
jgi:hypothetical protein